MRTIVVTGLMRSGTSLMMQILHNSGVECTGSWPHFEDEAVSQEGPIDQEWIEANTGRAWKWLEPYNRPVSELPDDALVIVMTRKHREQARSWAKILRGMNGWNRKQEKNIELQLRDGILKSMEESMCLHALKTEQECLEIGFEALLKRPEAVKDELAKKGLDINYEGVIKHRSPRNYDGLLEVDLYDRGSD